jgi:hypothetical protein
VAAAVGRRAGVVELAAEPQPAAASAANTASDPARLKPP